MEALKALFSVTTIPCESSQDCFDGEGMRDELMENRPGKAWTIECTDAQAFAS